MSALNSDSAVAGFTIRPARTDDLQRIADLIVQLYDSEAPGALIGVAHDKQELMRFTLEANGDRALRRRYVVCSHEGQVVASGMLQFPSDARFERAPAGTARRAVSLLGLRHALHTIFILGRALLTEYRRRDPEAALIHSVVVDRSFRRMGLGQMIVEELERIAFAAGYRWVDVQVMADNEPARRLYEKYGYQVVWRSPTWAKPFTWPTCVMRRGLPPGLRAAS